jgi:TatD DNase family protein
MGFSDSHCHMDGYQPQRLAEVLEQAKSKQVDIMVAVGMSLDSSEEVIKLANSNHEIVAAVGIHPWNAMPVTADVRNGLGQLARREGVVALGEIGLDFARSPETREVQKELLEYELSLAIDTGLPVNIHCREAHQDMMALLGKKVGSGLKGIAHGFSGDLAALKDWLDLDFYISIGRTVLMDEMTALRTAVPQIPLDRLLTETDSTPRREGASPTEVIMVAEKLASLRDSTVD